MSPGRVAMPSSRMRAPSLTIGKIMRSTISSDAIARRVMASRDEASRIVCSTSRSGVVAKITLPGLLSEMPGLAQRVLDLVALAAALADPPADIESGHVSHRERPHREPEPGNRGVDLLR